MVTAPEVLAAVRRQQVARRKVDRFRCGRAVVGDVLRMEPPWVTFGFSGAGRELTLVGLTVVEDEWLPETVWRLVDRDDTLLFDCREGRPLGEVA